MCACVCVHVCSVRMRLRLRKLCKCMHFCLSSVTSEVHVIARYNIRTFTYVSACRVFTYKSVYVREKEIRTIKTDLFLNQYILNMCTRAYLCSSSAVCYFQCKRRSCSILCTGKYLTFSSDTICLHSDRRGSPVGTSYIFFNSTFFLFFGSQNRPLGFYAKLLRVCQSYISIL